MSTSTELYGRQHYKNGPANAFRHALWNYLIAKNCFRWKEKVDTVILWTTEITDWHEKAFPNRDLAKKMDLHNNEIGRLLFKEHLLKIETHVVEILKEMTSDAIKIKADTDFTLIKNQLVYLIEDNER